MQITDGKAVIDSKKFDSPFNIIFVGRINAAKGVDILIDFIGKIKNSAIGFFHVVGEGGLKNDFENALNASGIPNKFYGNLTIQAEGQSFKIT